MIGKRWIIFFMILLVVNISYADDEGIDSENFFDSIFSRISNVLTGMAVGDLLFTDATLEIEPNEGYAGEQVKIIGKKFLSGAEITSLHILWDGDEIAEVAYPESGEFGVKVKVPDVKGGGRSKITIKEISGVVANFKVLIKEEGEVEEEGEVIPPPEAEPEAEPFIKLNYYSGLPGAKIKLTGADFPLLESSLLDVWKSKLVGEEKIITILFGEEKIIKTKYKTFFEEYFTVPEFDEGSYKITVANFSQVEPLVFVIRGDEDPYIMLNPSSGLPGDVIIIEGNNFPSGFEGGNLNILWDGDEFVEVPYPSDGRFKIYPMVPEVGENVTQCEITVKGYNNTLVYFDIESEEAKIPRITLSPSSVYAGENISVSGKNFPIGMVTYLNLLIGNKKISKFLYSGGGTFLTRVTIPYISSGIYPITVEGFATSYLNVSNLEEEINVSFVNETNTTFDGGEDDEGEDNGGEDDEGEGGVIVEEVGEEIIGENLIIITAKVSNTIGSNDCMPLCSNNCGQPDGCGGFCSMGDINTAGMCGNQEITNTYDNKTNEVANKIENVFGTLFGFG